MRVADAGRSARRLPRSRRSALPLALTLALLVPTFAAAAPQADPDAQAVAGAFVAYGHADEDPKRTLRRARNLLQRAGAGVYEAEQITLFDDLAPDAPTWLGPAERVACADGAATPAPLGPALATASDNLQFGRLEEARRSLEQLTSSLPCRTEVVSGAELYQLWFLRGALEYLEGRPGEARTMLARAAIVDNAAPFDESFPPALHDLLVQAKDEVLRRSEALVVVGSPRAVYVNGRAAGREITGFAMVPLRDGSHHLVQFETASGAMDSRLVRLDGQPFRADDPVAAVLDPDALRDQLSHALPGQGPAFGALVLHAWMAEQRLPWVLLVDATGEAGPGDPVVFQVHPLSPDMTVYEGRPTRGDAFTKRVRLAAYAGYRAQQGGTGPEDAARSYLQTQIGVWVPIHWVLRTGVTVQLAYTPNNQGDQICCALPEIGFRLRGEWPTGRLRPFVEGAMLIGWPFSHDPEAPETSGVNHPVWGWETGVGLLWTPGQARRIGINAAFLAGRESEILGWLKLQVGVEIRL